LSQGREHVRLVLVPVTFLDYLFVLLHAHAQGSEHTL
jgi:hypothetical protein